MSSDFDEGSFPKVRGWLLVFSSSIILLWFFGADLTSVSLLGTSVNFTRNTEYVWIVALIINLYLGLRFFQYRPDVAYAALPAYKSCYSALMLKFARWVPKQRIAEKVLDQSSVYSSSDVIKRLVKCIVESVEVKTYNQPSEDRRYSRGVRRVFAYSAYCLVRNDDGKTESTLTRQVAINCPYLLIFICVWLSRLKIWITTSYATEYILPYIWTAFAAVVCLVRWYEAAKAVMKWCT